MSDLICLEDRLLCWIQQSADRLWKSFLQSFVGLSFDSDVYTASTWESAGFTVVLLVNFTAKYT